MLFAGRRRRIRARLFRLPRFARPDRIGILCMGKGLHCIRDFALVRRVAECQTIGGKVKEDRE